MSLDLTTVTRIAVAGQPVVDIPSVSTPADMLAHMRIDINQFDATIEDGTLRLAYKSGDKGLIEANFLPDGSVVPKGSTNGSFPTDEHIKWIRKHFPEDNLFETLDSVTKVAEYYKAYVDSKKVDEKSELGKLIKKFDDFSAEVVELLVLEDKYLVSEAAAGLASACQILELVVDNAKVRVLNKGREEAAKAADKAMLEDMLAKAKAKEAEAPTVEPTAPAAE